ncbi:MAG: aspartate/glutamate racemase family protein [Pseudomonadota bacterium]
MHIGLIGGIGPAATDFYYRRLIRVFADASVDLDLTIAHADSRTLLDNLAQARASAQVGIYQRLTKRLSAAGAECLAVTSIAGHFCIGDFKPVSVLPVIDIVEEVDQAIAARGLARLGILGTRTVMATRLYAGIQSAEIIPPNGDMLDAVHDAYVTMAASGHVTAAQRSIFDQACQQLCTDRGAEAIILGGTDLALVYDAHSAAFPIVDCAAIHADAIARRAMAL